MTAVDLMLTLVRTRSLATISLTALALSSAHCGAKTGLDAPDIDAEAGPDAALDATLDAEADVAVDVPPRLATCRPIRYFARVGAVTNVRPDLDTLVTGTGFQWSLDTRPPGSNARIFSDATDTAVITPDIVGEFGLTVRVPATNAQMQPLTCVVTVVAQPPDPRCPGYALIEPRTAAIPGSTASIALDVSFTDPRTVMGTSGGVVLSEDLSARVSVGVLSRPAGTPDDADAWLAREGGAVEAATLSALNAMGEGTGLFIGRTAQLRSVGNARRTTFRLLADNDVSVDRVRSNVVRALTAGLAELPSAGHSAARAFVVEVSTLVAPMEQRVLVLIGVAPEGLVDDGAQITGIRLNDFANVSGIGAAGERLDTRCHQVRSTRPLSADFLWFVDTSGSMADDQQRVGRTGSRFFGDLTAAGVDFRVGVFQAGTATLNLQREGGSGTRSFSWIPGTAMDGARQLAWQVTEESFEPSDNLKPYRTASGTGQDEQPVGAAVQAYEEFERRRTRGEMNPEWLLRPQAVRVAFFVTDEPGGPNDIGRFFSRDPARWGADARTQVTRAAAFFRAQNVVPFGLVPDIATPGRARCSMSDPDNFAQCVILAAGGAFIPIGLADAREADRAFSQSMSRIVDAIAGAGSEFVLPTIPVSTTLRARVGGTLTPRSRVDGFDYEDRARALVFRGVRYRPAIGQDVRAAYFVWTRD
jgi:hypothetical protein